MRIVKKYELRGLDRKHGLNKQRIKQLSKNLALYSHEFLSTVFNQVQNKLFSLLSTKDTLQNLDLTPIRALLNASGPNIEILLNKDKLNTLVNALVSSHVSEKLPETQLETLLKLQHLQSKL